MRTFKSGLGDARGSGGGGFRGRASAIAFAVLLGVTGGSPARAQGVSDTVLKLTNQALNTDLAKTFQRNRAKQKLAFADSLCRRGCNPEATGSLELLRGIIRAYEGKKDESREAFAFALEADPAIDLPSRHADGAPGALWDEVSATDEEAPVLAPPPREPAPPVEKKKPKAPPEDREPDDDASGLPIELRAAAQVSGYSDTDSVDVINPGLLIGVEDPVNGWGVNASFLVDVVSAASPDIVATASPGWVDIRFAPAIGGHVKIDDVDLSINGSYSQESDHRGITAGVGVAVDTMNKQVTPSIAYSFGYDTAGRNGTPFDVYALNLQRHGLVGGVTIVLDKATILVPGATVVFEAGRQEKPYRYLPIFDPNTPLEPGESIDSVNEKRLDGRMEERLPDLRLRGALSALLAHRTGSVTIRVSERLYADNWGQLGTTTDVTVPWDVTKRVRIWPHLRVHAQTAVDFWQLGYTAVSNRGAAGGASLNLPQYRTGDREMGPMVGVTGGGGVRVALGERTPALSFTGDVIYTRWLRHLYRTERLGGFGVLTLEVETR
ncbi:MAG: DUF3570 domain-containing protein [Myxococcota bacterium]